MSWDAWLFWLAIVVGPPVIIAYIRWRWKK